jgi:hypothetical protein
MADRGSISIPSNPDAAPSLLSATRELPLGVMESFLRVRSACRAAKAAQVDSRKSEADLYFSDRRFERNNDIWLAEGRRIITSSLHPVQHDSHAIWRQICVSYELG